MYGGSVPLEIYQVLLSNLVTEKSTFQKAKLNQFSFRVPVAATKELVRKAVQEAFGVRVDAVRTQLYKELPKRFRVQKGWLPAWKKAIVTIHKDETLPF